MADWPELTHYSDEPIRRIASKEQEAGPSFKPIGLWVSVDEGGDGWADWCRSEGFRPSNLRHVHNVNLWRDARIMHLRTAVDLDDFTNLYGERLSFGEDVSYAPLWIRWDRVAEEYAGIIIAPYQWSRRLDDRAPWYYSWDCASGCIWDANAISSVRLRQSDEAAA